MSNYYLCDLCEHWIRWRPNYTGLDGRCDKTEESGVLFAKRVMFDYHGKDGKRYDAPTDVCWQFKARGVDQ